MDQKPQSNPSPLPNGAIKTTLHRECLKNHAATLGRHALDGCREFLPSPAVNFSDPSSLKCAACGCHRNFHRRISLSSSSPHDPQIEYSGADDRRRRRTSISAPHALLALSRDERPFSMSKKRFRTKFSAEQKGRMMELSERIGWRLQKRDEGLVEDCCREIGVGKRVFKVWMHNNKYQIFRAFRRGEERGDVNNAMNGSSSSS